jgi:hypothetical protein
VSAKIVPETLKAVAEVGAEAVIIVIEEITEAAAEVAVSAPSKVIAAAMIAIATVTATETRDTINPTDTTIVPKCKATITTAKSR